MAIYFSRYCKTNCGQRSKASLDETMTFGQLSFCWIKYSNWINCIGLEIKFPQIKLHSPIIWCAILSTNSLSNSLQSRLSSGSHVLYEPAKPSHFIKKCGWKDKWISMTMLWINKINTKKWSKTYSAIFHRSLQDFFDRKHVGIVAHFSSFFFCRIESNMCKDVNTLK